MHLLSLEGGDEEDASDSALSTILEIEGEDDESQEEVDLEDTRFPDVAQNEAPDRYSGVQFLKNQSHAALSI